MSRMQFGTGLNSSRKTTNGRTQMAMQWLVKPKGTGRQTISTALGSNLTPNFRNSATSHLWGVMVPTHTHKPSVLSKLNWEWTLARQVGGSSRYFLLPAFGTDPLATLKSGVKSLKATLGHCGLTTTPQMVWRTGNQTPTTSCTCKAIKTMETGPYSLSSKKSASSQIHLPQSL